MVILVQWTQSFFVIFDICMECETDWRVSEKSLSGILKSAMIDVMCLRAIINDYFRKYCFLSSG